MIRSDRDNTEEKIRRFMAVKFPVMTGQGEVNGQESLINGGIIDSLGILDLITFLEEQFEITVTNEDLTPNNFETIALIASFVSAKSNGKVAP